MQAQMQDEEVDAWEGIRGPRRLQLTIGANSSTASIAGLGSPKSSIG